MWSSFLGNSLTVALDTSLCGLDICELPLFFFKPIHVTDEPGIKNRSRSTARIFGEYI